jgi:hypothetical protein
MIAWPSVKRAGNVVLHVSRRSTLLVQRNIRHVNVERRDGRLCQSTIVAECLIRFN